MTNQVLDPVCGMTIDARNATGTSKFEDRTYYFCSHTCEAKFDAHPETYSARQETQQPPAACCSPSGSCHTK